MVKAWTLEVALGLSIASIGCVSTDFETLCDINPDASLCRTTAGDASTEVDSREPDTTAAHDSAPEDASDSNIVDSAPDTPSDTPSDGTSGCEGGAPTRACGNCGTQTATCMGRDWVWGVCSGEGACKPGAIDATGPGCPAGEASARICQTDCTWGTFGACYNPAGWKPIATPTILSARSDPAATWTGSRMFVWGGAGTTVLNDGGLYDPISDSWTALPATTLSPRHSASAAWTGTKVLVWGGIDGAGVGLHDGALYDPAAGTWSLIPSTSVTNGFTGLWLSSTSEFAVTNGTRAAFKPSTGTWRTLATPGFTPCTQSTTLQGKLFVMGNVGGCESGTYDPSGDSWTVAAALPSTIDGLYFIGGEGPDGVYLLGRAPGVPGSGVGVRFDGTTGAWSTLATPPIGLWTTPVPLGATDVVLFFEAIDLVTGVGPACALYDPTAGKWALLAPVDVVLSGEAVVWTGTEAILWGGSISAVGPTNTGRRIRPR